jgi:hypothetical protein
VFANDAFTNEFILHLTFNSCVVQGILCKTQSAGTMPNEVNVTSSNPLFLSCADMSKKKNGKNTN